MTTDEIKDVLKQATNTMPDDEKQVVNKAIETIFTPVAANFNPAVQEVEQWEIGCNGEFLN